MKPKYIASVLSRVVQVQRKQIEVLASTNAMQSRCKYNVNTLQGGEKQQRNLQLHFLQIMLPLGKH